MFLVDPVTHVISIPKTDLTLISGTLYEHDTEAFRLQLKSWEDSIEGITQPKTHNHNTAIVIAGVTYARAIAILPPYSIEYEDGQYTVLLKGSNNNIFDVGSGILVQNQVQVIPSNSAGLISSVVETGVSGLTSEESQALLDIAADQGTIQSDIAAIQSEIASIGGSFTLMQGDVSTIQGDIETIKVDLSGISGNIVTIETNVGLIQASISSMETALELLEAIERGEWKIEENQMIFYNLASVEIARFDLFDDAGNPTSTTPFRRVPV